MLERPVQDLQNIAALKDEVFWQVTSARVLGILKSPAAIRPLMKVVVSPLKVDMAAEAVTALIKIGKPAVAPAIALLQSRDAELVGYSRSESERGALQSGHSRQATGMAATAHVAAAAVILGSIGRDEAAAPMIAQLGRSNDVERAILARELTKLPKSETIVKAVQQVYEKTPLDLTIPPGLAARETLLEAAGGLFDASLTPWIVKTAGSLRGDASDVDAIRAASFQVALKLMTREQIAEVDKLYRMNAIDAAGRPATIGQPFHKEYAIAKDLLGSCTNRVECYLTQMAEPSSQAPDTQFRGIKAAYMLGVLGTPDIREKIIDVLPKIKNAAVRFVCVSVIDSLSPRGDTKLASALQRIVDEGEDSRDRSVIMGNATLKTVIYRLRARAQ